MMMSATTAQFQHQIFDFTFSRLCTELMIWHGFILGLNKRILRSLISLNFVNLQLVGKSQNQTVTSPWLKNIPTTISSGEARSYKQAIGAERLEHSVTRPLLENLHGWHSSYKALYPSVNFFNLWNGIDTLMASCFYSGVTLGKKFS